MPYALSPTPESLLLFWKEILSNYQEGFSTKFSTGTSVLDDVIASRSAVEAWQSHLPDLEIAAVASLPRDDMYMSTTQKLVVRNPQKCQDYSDNYLQNWDTTVLLERH
jgi:hypothetical protein